MGRPRLASVTLTVWLTSSPGSLGWRLLPYPSDSVYDFGDQENWVPSRLPPGFRSESYPSGLALCITSCLALLIDVVEVTWHHFWHEGSLAASSACVSGDSIHIKSPHMVGNQPTPGEATIVL